MGSLMNAILTSDIFLVGAVFALFAAAALYVRFCGSL